MNSDYVKDLLRRVALSAAHSTSCGHGRMSIVDPCTCGLSDILREVNSALLSDLTVWQPIEIAPRDGSEIFVYSPQWNKPFLVTWAKAGRRFWTHNGRRLAAQPTLWHPVPSMPLK